MKPERAKQLVTPTSEDILDVVETTLIYILDGTKVEKISEPELPTIRTAHGHSLVGTNTDHRAEIEPLTIECPLVYGGTTERLHALTRWISSDPNDLVTPVPDIIGDGIEQICCADEIVKWWMIRPVKKLPKRYYARATGKLLFFEYHFRQWHYLYPESGAYTRFFAAYSPEKKNWFDVFGPRDKYFGQVGISNNFLLTRFSLNSTCSLEEDANLFWRIKLTDSASCYLSADSAAVLDLCKNRHAPLTNSGRRRAIMHWVRNYTRRGNVTLQEVKEHLRGVYTFNFGPTLVELFAPPFEAAFETNRVAKLLKKKRRARNSKRKRL